MEGSADFCLEVEGKDGIVKLLLAMGKLAHRTVLASLEGLEVGTELQLQFRPFISSLF